MARRLLPLPLALAFVLGLPAKGHAVAPPGVLRDRYGDPLPPGAIARLGSMRFRHVGVEGHAKTGLKLGSNRPVFSPDGRSIVTFGSNARLWDIASGRLLREFRHDWDDQTRGGIFSPDGAHFLTLHSVQVCVWDLQGDRKVLLPPTPTSHTSPGGGAGEGRSQADRIRLRKTIQPGHTPLGIAFHPTRALFAVQVEVGYLPQIRMYEFPSCRLLSALYAKTEARAPADLTFSPDGQRLAYASMCYLHSFDLAQGKELPAIKVGAYVNKLDFTPDSRWLALDLENEPISLVCLEGRPTHVPIGMKGGHRTDKRYLPGRKEILFADHDGSVISFEPFGLNKPRVILPARELKPDLVPHDTVALSPDGRRVAFTCGPLLRVIDLATRCEVTSFDDHRDAGSVEAVVAPCGRFVATRSISAIRVWELKTGKLIRRIDSIKVVDGLGITKDGRHVVACEDSRVTWWDINTGKVVRKLQLPDSCSKGIALFGQGQAVACNYSWGNRNGVAGLIFDANSGKEVMRLAHGSGIYHLGPAGQVKLSIDEDGCAVRIQDLRSGRIVWEGVPLRKAHSTFSQDGRLFFCLTTDCFEIRDTADGRRVRPRTTDHINLKEHRLCFLSPEGRTLYVHPEKRARGVISEDDWTGRGGVLTHDGSIVLIMETSSGKIRRRFSSKDRITPLANSSDGRYLVTMEGDGSILIRDIYHVRTGENPSAAQLWADLASDNAEKAFEAVCRMVADSTVSVREIGNRLKSVRIDRGRVERWMDDLDSDSYEVREEASRELSALGDDIEDHLRRARLAATQLETSRRLDRLLARVGRSSEDPIYLQRERALEVLEQMSTTEARAVVQRLADEAKETWLSKQARAVLSRMSSRVGR